MAPPPPSFFRRAQGDKFSFPLFYDVKVAPPRRFGGKTNGSGELLDSSEENCRSISEAAAGCCFLDACESFGMTLAKMAKIFIALSFCWALGETEKMPLLQAGLEEGRGSLFFSNN